MIHANVVFVPPLPSFWKPPFIPVAIRRHHHRQLHFCTEWMQGHFQKIPNQKNPKFGMQWFISLCFLEQPWPGGIWTWATRSLTGDFSRQGLCPFPCPKLELFVPSLTHNGNFVSLLLSRWESVPHSSLPRLKLTPAVLHCAYWLKWSFV